MSQAQTFYEGHSFYEGLTRWSVRERIGHGLRERYQVPTELPSKLLALIMKLEAIESEPLHARTLIGTLDAIEGRYLKRYTLPAEPPERRSKRRLAFVHLKVGSQGRLQ